MTLDNTTTIDITQDQDLEQQQQQQPQEVDLVMMTTTTTTRNQDEEQPLKDVPKGLEQPNETPGEANLEKQKQITTSISSNENEEERTNRKSRWGLMIASLIGICIVIAILVALLPDWSNETQSSNAAATSSSSNSNGSDTSKISNGDGTTTTTTTTEGTSNQSFFLSTQGSPFDAKLPLFSSEATTPYANKEEVRSDLQQLARFLLNGFITDNVKYGSGGGGWGAGGAIPEMALDADRGPSPPAAAAPTSDGGASTSAAAEADDAFGNIDDFETYQQEQGVVRSDMVKSDGVHVYTATQDQILVWNVDGQLLNTVSVPPRENTESPISPGQPVPLPVDVEDTEELVDVDVATTTSTSSSEAAAEAKSSIAPYEPKPYVTALLLVDDKLVAVVGGYGSGGMMYERPVVDTTSEGKDSPGEVVIPVVNNYMDTKIIVYAVGEGGGLNELSQTTINGNHINSFSIGTNVHIVSKAGLNTWSYLSEPIQRWNPEFQGMDDETYQAAAILKSQSLIDNFVNEVLNVIVVDDEISLSRLSVFTDSLPDIDLENMTDESPFFYSDVIADSMTQVISFDVSTVQPGVDVVMSSATTMQPGGWGYVYATPDWIWVADQGWSWIESESLYADKSMFLGFKLNGASSTLAAVGSAPGSLLNQFAIDFFTNSTTGEEFVRVATTLDFGWRGWGLVDARPEQGTTTSTTVEEDRSRTKNQVIILQIPSTGNEMIQRGSIELGKKDETITAVRFFDDVSYVVTFERTDPFYVLDLSNVDDPVILGELEIPGFSQFMHPIKEGDSTMLIAVGQAANNDGVVTGLQISIFDSTIPTEPRLVDRLSVEDDPNQSSSTSAAWDERAFRYLQVGDLGRLIIPVSMFSSEWDEVGNFIGTSFEGFMTFGIDLSKTENLISQLGSIDHSRATQNNQDQDDFQPCYCYSWLPERNLVFGGNVMTMRNQKVISTSLVSQETQWTLDLDEQLKCCPAL